LVTEESNLPMSVLGAVHDDKSIIGISRPTPEPVSYGKRRSDKIPWAGAAVLLAAILLVFFGKSAMPALFGTPVPFELQATDVNGQMKIRWNGQADAVTNAETASLEIKDGGQEYQYPVSRDVLAAGALDYTRRTGDVVASLVLQKGGRETERRLIRSISPPSSH
jgi:hypothetical protein